MARIRSLHPGQWTDEAFVSVSMAARLLALALRNEADDQGVFEWKPAGLKMRLLPMDAVDVSALLSELEGADIIKRYVVGGRQLGAIRNFCRYQRPKKPNKVHTITDEVATYTASTHNGSVPVGNQDEDTEGDGGSGGGKSPQMKEEGGRRDLKKEPKGSSGVSPAARQPAYHLPKDWKPDDRLRDYAAKLGLQAADIDREIVKFLGWFADGQGSGERRNDRGWRQTWQRWVGKAAERLPPSPRAPGDAPKPGSPEWYAANPHLRPTL